MNEFGKHNMKVSIITVCYNAEKYIEKAIQSVLDQTYKNIEYIIVDGKSADSTMRIVEKYKDRISKIISEKDSGIYEAMNKGIKTAAGDILYFLNCDDYFCNRNTVENIVNEFKQDDNLGIVYGRINYFNKPREASLIAAQEKEFKTKMDLIFRGICHQSIFSRKWVFERIGLFDERFRIHADFDWILSAFNGGIKFKFINEPIACYNYTGMSYLKRNETMIDRIKVVRKHANLIEFGCYFMYASIRKIRDTLLEVYSSWKEIIEK